MLLVAPLAVPAFVNSYGWVSLDARRRRATPARSLIVTLSYFPLVYLPVAAALRGLDPGLEETAHSLGLGPWRTFFRVVLPQLRPALLGGALLVALHLLAEFGALQMLRFPTFTTAIYDQYQSTFNGPAANMLAGVLVLLLPAAAARPSCGCAGAAGTRGSAAARARPAPGRRSAGRPCRCSAGLTALVVLALGVPLGSLSRWLLVGSLDRVSPSPSCSARPRTSSASALAARRRSPSLLALPVGLAGGAPPRPGVGTSLERSTYIATPCPGSWSPWRWSRSRSGCVARSTRPRRCCSRPTRSCSCPRAVVSSGPRWRRRRRCSIDVARSLGDGPGRRRCAG